MSDDTQRPIIVKRIKKGGHGQHGGTWKIAYADFVTAMMAFFLLMWLLGSITRGDLKGIADYFNTPLRVALLGGSATGESQSVIPGGGEDWTRKVGEVAKGRNEPQDNRIDTKLAQQIVERTEEARLQELKDKIEGVIDSNPQLRQFRKQLLIDLTPEGLRVQIVDEQHRPMFATGSSQVQPYMRDLLREIGKVLNEVPNRVSIAGHTDATAFAGGERGFSNWELSAERANAARRELVAGGMSEAKVMRVVGLSSVAGFPGAAPLDPINRRISIIVLNRKTELAIATDPGARGEPVAPQR
jgi:chemotaxis protein MotB